MTDQTRNRGPRAAAPPWGPKPARGPIREVISGYRFYNPSLGRWINRDPILEWGGLNLYSMHINDFISAYDRLGLSSSSEYPPFDGAGIACDSGGFCLVYRDCSGFEFRHEKNLRFSVKKNGSTWTWESEDIWRKWLLEAKQTCAWCTDEGTDVADGICVDYCTTSIKEPKISGMYDIVTTQGKFMPGKPFAFFDYDYEDIPEKERNYFTFYEWMEAIYGTDIVVLNLISAPENMACIPQKIGED